MATRGQAFLFGCGFLLVSGLFALAVGVLLWKAGDGSFAGLGRDRVGLVVIEGPIVDARYWVEELEANRRDPSIGAVVVRIDSPGGSVAPSQELHGAIRRLRAEKPVVASLGGVAASGGYYAAVAADSIVSNPGTLTGSIGVIFEFPTVVQLLDKIGVRHHVYKSGELKDIGIWSREPTEVEEALLDGIIADVYEQFVTAVTEGRSLPRSEVIALADGRVFSGRQAYEAGLVDRLGDLHDSVLLAARMGGLGDDPQVVRKSRPLAPWLVFLDRMLRETGYLSQTPGLAYRFR
jgi:protease-4